MKFVSQIRIVLGILGIAVSSVLSKIVDCWLITRGAPDLEFSIFGTGFTGFGQKFRPDLPDLKQDILG